MRDAFFKLGELQIAASNLVPLLTTYPDDEDLVFNARERTLIPIRFDSI